MVIAIIPVPINALKPSIIAILWSKLLAMICKGASSKKTLTSFLLSKAKLLFRSSAVIDFD